MRRASSNAPQAANSTSPISLKKEKEKKGGGIRRSRVAPANKRCSSLALTGSNAGVEAPQEKTGEREGKLRTA